MRTCVYVGACVCMIIISPYHLIDIGFRVYVCVPACAWLCECVHVVHIITSVCICVCECAHVLLSVLILRARQA